MQNQYDSMGQPEETTEDKKSSSTTSDCKVVGTMELPSSPQPQRARVDKKRVNNFNTPTFITEDGKKTKQAKDVHAALRPHKKGKANASK